MTKRQNTHVLKIENVYDVIMTAFFKPKHLKFCTTTFHEIVLAHKKFGLVRMKGSGVKRGDPPGLSEFLNSLSG